MQICVTGRGHAALAVTFKPVAAQRVPLQAALLWRPTQSFRDFGITPLAGCGAGTVPLGSTCSLRIL